MVHPIHATRARAARTKMIPIVHSPAVGGAGAGCGVSACADSWTGSAAGAPCIATANDGVRKKLPTEPGSLHHHDVLRVGYAADPQDRLVAHVAALLDRLDCLAADEVPDGGEPQVIQETSLGHAVAFVERAHLDLEFPLAEGLAQEVFVRRSDERLL